MVLSCECDYDSAPRFYSCVWRTARKHHLCCECRNVVAIGDKYQVIAGVWEDGFETYKTCEKCADLRDSMSELGYCASFGDLLSDHAEYKRELQENRK